MKINDLKNGSIIINGKDKCINTCTFCYGYNEHKTDNEKWSNFIKDAQYFIDNKFFSIEISGSDPGEYEYIAEAILYLKDNGIKKIQLSTHGRMFSDKDFTTRVAMAGLDYLRIPIYGITANIHNKTTDINNWEKSRSFEETVQGIKNAAEQNIIIAGHTLINQYNKDQINDIIKFYNYITSGRLKEIIIGRSYLSETLKENAEGWYLSSYEANSALRSIDVNLPPYVKFMIQDYPYCAFGSYTDLIEFTSTPDLGNHKIEEENKSKDDDQKPFYRVNTFFKECNYCDYKNKCSGITTEELNNYGVKGLIALRNSK